MSGINGITNFATFYDMDSQDPTNQGLVNDQSVQNGQWVQNDANGDLNGITYAMNTINISNYNIGLLDRFC